MRHGPFAQDSVSRSFVQRRSPYIYDYSTFLPCDSMKCEECTYHIRSRLSFTPRSWLCRNINRCWVLRDNRLLPSALRCPLWAARLCPLLLSIRLGFRPSNLFESVLLSASLFLPASALPISVW